MEDSQLATQHLSEFAALGFKLAIDDYGVGQASLAYLKTQPVHELKIDRTFVRSVHNSPTNAAIVSSTIVLCHALGLTVVAEGAETAEELDWLADNGCDAAQGFHIARPMPADELPGMDIEQRKPRDARPGPAGRSAALIAGHYRRLRRTYTASCVSARPMSPRIHFTGEVRKRVPSLMPAAP